ncbi:MAG TPA: serine/threonine-protein kinase [Gemmatimonadaceae bacterium]|nr:serine/threonine-protein kinase [Gemmatimonadaceae bacterium]
MPDPIALSSDAELRALVDRSLSESYELDRELGRGGMGIVYRAKDRRLKRIVAIKVLPPELSFRSEIRSRFLREAETAAQLNHPNIVPIYSVDERDGIVYFVMACVEGDTLAKVLHDRPQLDIDETRRILIGVGDALAYANARGVVHRDIKPDNILLDRESSRPMVTDFGIARAVLEGGDSRLTATGVAIGTPAYMSPEQAAGDREIDGRSDLYALGVVAYQMLAGQLPFNAASTPTMLLKHISELPMPIERRRADVPPDLAAIVMTLLEKEPERRFSDAGTMVAALKGETTPSYPRTAAAYTPSPSAGSSAAGRTAPPGMGDARQLAPVGAPYPAPATPPWGTTYDAPHEPTSEEALRWTAAPVARFRRRFGFYAAVNSVIVIFAIFGVTDMISITVLWSILMAFWYGRLWSAGYDWRDVFRQPRERRLLDVATETADEVRAIFDKEERERQRERRRQRRLSRRTSGGSSAHGASPLASPGALPPITPAAAAGPRGDVLLRAEQDRQEIVRQVEALPRADRAVVADVVPAADALVLRIRDLVRSLSELDRAAAPAVMESVEREIAQLESEANPLEGARSEQRVRRLAELRRARRATGEAVRQREDSEARLESCAVALQNMRYDILRLRAGSVAGASQQITVLTDRARALADEVDAVVGAGRTRRNPGTGHGQPDRA